MLRLQLVDLVSLQFEGVVGLVSEDFESLVGEPGNGMVVFEFGFKDAVKFIGEGMREVLVSLLQLGSFNLHIDEIVEIGDSAIDLVHAVFEGLLEGLNRLL